MTPPAPTPSPPDAELPRATPLHPLDAAVLDPVSALAATDLFGEMAPSDLATIAEAFSWGLVAGGHLLMKQGDAGDRLYVVVTGKLQVVVEDGEGGETVIHEVGRGGNVGEMALLTGAPRSASVRAVRDTVVGALQRDRFEVLLRAHPETALALNRILASWIATRRRTRPAPPPPTTLTVTTEDPHLALNAFADALIEALSRLGPTRTVRAIDVEHALGPDASEADPDTALGGTLSAWLHEQETACQYLVYVAPPGEPGWARRCTRQADRVVTVTTPTGPPPRPRQAVAREVLVVLHEASASRPEGTARLHPDAFDRLHHVRSGHAGDLDRLARHLSGQAVGLVLGGGGARAFAHIGVIKALREAGVPIDAVGGTSMGAVVGALCAQELDRAELIARSRLWAQHRPHADYTAPIVALLSGRRGRSMLRAMFGDVQIEDLWLPYFAVSADLTSAREVVHRSGSLAHWLRATIAIPGVAPPLAAPPSGLLVDGAVLNNVPVDVMQRGSDGPVIAVDVAAQADFSLSAWGDEVPSAFAVVRDRLLGRPPRPFPSLYRVLARASTLASARNDASARERAALYLKPPVTGFDLFAWSDLEPIVEAGYRYACERLARGLPVGFPVSLTPRPRS